MSRRHRRHHHHHHNHTYTTISSTDIRWSSYGVAEYGTVVLTTAIIFCPHCKPRPLTKISANDLTAVRRNFRVFGVVAIFYPHMPIDKVWISVTACWCVCVCVCVSQCVFVCTVTNFTAEDKANGVKFCTAVHRHPRQGISHFCELCSPKSPKSDEPRHQLHDVYNYYSLASEHMIARRVDVGSTCVDIRQSPKTDVLVKF